jgi:hypothetical protein
MLVTKIMFQTLNSLNASFTNNSDNSLLPYLKIETYDWHVVKHFYMIILK